MPGTAVTQTTIQFAQVIGFASGGAAVAFLGVRASLLADAVTFMVSAVIAWLWVRARLGSSSPTAAGRAGASGIRAGLRLVFTLTALLVPMLFGSALRLLQRSGGDRRAAGRNLGGGDVAVGLILAAAAFGASVGGLLFGRLVMPRQRLRWMSPLAVLSCAVLILFALRPPLVLALLILTVSGVCGCYQLAASAAFVRATPGGQRSQAFGLAQGGMNLGQGVAMIMAGAAARALRAERRDRGGRPAWCVCRHVSGCAPPGQDQDRGHRCSVRESTSPRWCCAWRPPRGMQGARGA